MTLLRLALRNLARNRRRTTLSLVAIVVGVAAMVGFRGFVNGQRTMVLDGLIKGITGAIQVHKKGYVQNVQALPLTLDMADSEELRQRMRSVPGVLEVSPRISFGGMLSTPATEEDPGKTSAVVVGAFDPLLEATVTPERFRWIARGRMFASKDSAELVANASLVTGLGLSVHPDEAARPEPASWPALLSSDREGALNGESGVVTGELESAMPGDRRIIYVPLALAQRLLRMEGRVTEYAIAVEDYQHAPAIAARLRQVLGPEYEVHAWDELLGFIRDVVQQQDFMLALVGFIFLGVVLLGIANAMLMNVLERVREIGTMLAVGTRRRQIVRLFVLEGAVLGLVGGAVGALVGYAAVQYLHHVGLHYHAPGTEVDSVIRPYVAGPYLVRAAVTAIVGACLAALWPAYRASRLNPIDALRSL